MSPLHKRILTALVLLTVLILIVKQGEPWITGLFAILGLGMLGEWVYNLLKAQKSIATKLYLLTLGTPYILFGTFGFYQVYQLNPLMVLHFLLIIWITDTAAFFTGKLIGGPKLWPAVSPNKTWSGSLGGVAFVIIYYGILQFFYREEAATYLGQNAIYFMVIVSIVGQLGDLLESAAKRFLKIKDTSQLLPGHGGLLDRLDSFLAVGLLAYAFLKFA